LKPQSKPGSATTGGTAHTNAAANKQGTVQQQAAAKNAGAAGAQNANSQELNGDSPKQGEGEWPGPTVSG